MTKAPALEPCPNRLCGKPFAVMRRSPASSMFYGRCDICMCEGPHRDTEAEAIASWNARPGDAARETTITEAIQALIDAGDYFSARADVNDGDYGVPSPNREMTLASQCDEALERLEALRTHGSQP